MHATGGKYLVKTWNNAFLFTLSSNPLTFPYCVLVFLSLCSENLLLECENDEKHNDSQKSETEKQEKQQQQKQKKVKENETKKIIKQNKTSTPWSAATSTLPLSCPILGTNHESSLFLNVAPPNGPITGYITNIIYNIP